MMMRGMKYPSFFRLLCDLSRRAQLLVRCLGINAAMLKGTLGDARPCGYCAFHCQCNHDQYEEQADIQQLIYIMAGRQKGQDDTE
jgi:hypothetical protein